ncbi:LppA family lipoprotein [Pseudonocardia sp. HH130630-07]|uniref:LppA family lipoprotein n=1 Tax=Pseudonocardia sp. HH130630-07 TaxID=1690815 RepID=UPI0009F3EB00
MRTDSRRPRRHTSTALALALLCALSAACGIGQETTIDPRAELNARMSLEEATIYYQQMDLRTRAATESVVGPRTWEVTDTPARDSCGFGRFEDIEGAHTEVFSVVVVVPLRHAEGVEMSRTWGRAPVEQLVDQDQRTLRGPACPILSPTPLSSRSGSTPWPTWLGFWPLNAVAAVPAPGGGR